MVEPHHESYRCEVGPEVFSERETGKPRLLIVTADDTLRDDLASALGDIYRIRSAPTAEHALPSLEREPSDLVVASLNLPGMSGLELLRRVQTSYPDTGVILMALQPSISEAAQAFKIGALDYLPAPFRLRDILKAIEEALPELETRRRLHLAEAKRLTRLERMRKQLEQLRALQDVSQMLTANLAPEALMTMVLDQAIVFSGAERGGLLLVNDDGEFALRVARHMDQTTIGQESFDISRRIARQVFRLGLPVLVNAIEGSKQDVYSYMSRDQPRSILCAPLLRQGRPTEVIYLDKSFGTDNFNNEHLEMVRVIADQGSIALENARLNREAQQRAQKLEKEAREMAERLIKAERLAAIGEITVAVRHEINNPLTSLLLQVELLRETQEGLPAEVQRALDYIYMLCQRIADVTSRLTSVRDRKVHYARGIMMTDLSSGEEEEDDT
jgi:ActR/RegA family two-component response regulator/GAF domain-containing protein